MEKFKESKWNIAYAKICYKQEFSYNLLKTAISLQKVIRYLLSTELLFFCFVLKPAIIRLIYFF